MCKRFDCPFSALDFDQNLSSMHLQMLLTFSETRLNAGSAWDRDQEEKDRKTRERDARLRLEAEVSELERKPYLTPEEQDRLSKLRLEQEFQRRVQEVESKDDDDDSDTDITERAAVRIRFPILH